MVVTQIHHIVMAEIDTLNFQKNENEITSAMKGRYVIQSLVKNLRRLWMWLQLHEVGVLLGQQCWHRM